MGHDDYWGHDPSEMARNNGGPQLGQGSPMDFDPLALYAATKIASITSQANASNGYQYQPLQVSTYQDPLQYPIASYESLPSEPVPFSKLTLSEKIMGITSLLGIFAEALPGVLFFFLLFGNGIFSAIKGDWGGFFFFVGIPVMIFGAAVYIAHREAKGYE